MCSPRVFGSAPGSWDGVNPPSGPPLPPSLEESAGVLGGPINNTHSLSERDCATLAGVEDETLMRPRRTRR